MRHPILSTFILIGLSACTTVPQEPLRAEIQGKTKEQVSDRVASLCQDYGFNVEGVTQSTVNCSRSSGTGAQILFGTKYGSGVESHVQFTILSPNNKTVRVIPRAWFQNMNAYMVGSKKRRLYHKTQKKYA